MISITQQKPLICDVNIRKITLGENLFKRQQCLKTVKLGNYMKTVSRVISVHISISIEAVVAVPSVELLEIFKRSFARSLSAGVADAQKTLSGI